MGLQTMKSQGAAGVQAISAVKIDLYKGTALSKKITASTENTGGFEWRVPKTLENGTNYKIRVSVAADANIFFDSPNIILRFEYPISTR